MALNDFRVEGVGLISQSYTAGLTGGVIVADGTNNHSTVDNYDSDGTALIWTQPQPRAKIYYLVIANTTGSVATVDMLSDGTKINQIKLAANASKELGSAVKPGFDAPIYVCNPRESFDMSADEAVNVYAQYRVATPKKIGD